jgi:hypothetical protein
MGQLVGNALSGMQARGAIAPVQNQQPAQLPMQAMAQMPQQAAQAVAQPPAPLAGGQAQGLANAPAFVQQMVAQLMADRAANQQASMGQPFQGVTGQPVPDNFMPRPGFGQQGFGMQGQFPQQAMQGMQNMPFNMPMRSNYFFGPMGSSFQSMQQQQSPFGGGFGGFSGFGGGQQGLFGFNPYMNPRIY